MKSVNLYELYTSSKLKIADYRNYEKILSNRSYLTNLGEREKGSIYYLVSSLLENGLNINKLDNFYYSYTIPHIGKEFDLLKIDNKYILNIELKSQNVGLERIKTQLMCNYKYLKYLSKKTYLFTFVSDVKEFYYLDNDFNLVKTDIFEVIKIMNLFNQDELDIDKLFKANDYLVSPISTPLKFIEGQYFLTTQQEFIKNKLINSLDEESYFKITGDAGTGKTLLLFDIAKTLAKKGKVFILLGNQKTEAHNLISEALKIDILDQDELHGMYHKIKDSDYILIEEVQRIRKHIWFNIFNFFEKETKKVVFSLDPKQVLTKEEIKNNINSFIDGQNPVKYKLSNKIRINNNIANFTYRLFDLSLKKYPLDFSNVSIIFANNPHELNVHLNRFKEDYVYIDIANQFDFKNKVSINEVLGKDYDNVLMILDNNFYYENTKLKTHNSKTNDFLYLKLLYQGLSRTRENLVLIIYKNKKLFTKIISEGVNDETNK